MNLNLERDRLSPEAIQILNKNQEIRLFFRDINWSLFFYVATIVIQNTFFILKIKYNNVCLKILNLIMFLGSVSLFFYNYGGLFKCYGVQVLKSFFVTGIMNIILILTWKLLNMMFSLPMSKSLYISMIIVTVFLFIFSSAASISITSYKFTLQLGLAFLILNISCSFLTILHGNDYVGLGFLIIKFYSKK